MRKCMLVLLRADKKLLILVGCVAIGAILWPIAEEKLRYEGVIIDPIKRSAVANQLGQIRIDSKRIQNPIHIKIDEQNYYANTTIDAELQRKVEKIFKNYNPKYAAFVALDAKTGRILAMVDHRREPEALPVNLTLQASYPAASIFKVVTSAAAISEGKLTPRSRIPFNGSYTSLYKRNLSYKTNRWTRFLRLDFAFSKSVNSIFGKIAVFGLGQGTLQKYANAFGFNQNIDFDLPLNTSRVEVPKDKFGIAESGSGYTRHQTLSPLQAALIAASVINDGKVPDPFLFKNIKNEYGHNAYEHEEKTILEPMDYSTSQKLGRMMEKTIINGTGRRYYRDYRRHPILSRLFIGAKTGSLTGLNPRGKYDWFVGFAKNKMNDGNKIAFATMIVNGKYWRVKSTYVARQAILQHFKSLKSL